MNWTKEKRYGLIGTVIFHAILLVLFLTLAFRTPLPLPGEEGVEVNLGYSNVGQGKKQYAKAPKTSPKPKQESVKPKTTTSPKPQKVSNDQSITQNTEDAPALPKEKKPEKAKIDSTRVKTPSKVLADNTSKPKEKVEETPKVNPRALYKGPSKSSSDGGSEGITNQPGNQGKPNGTLGAQKYEGEGGLGNGISFSLNGRSAKNIPKPGYNSTEQGRVVVTIYVDKSGRVLRAQAGAKGTNVSDPSLRRVAEKAALKAKFSESSAASQLQKGTITYNFIRMN
ncbi:MAG: energy transducer TonB [Hyphomicrobiales bacterium]